MPISRCICLIKSPIQNSHSQPRSGYVGKVFLFAKTIEFRECYEHIFGNILKIDLPIKYFQGVKELRKGV